MTISKKEVCLLDTNVLVYAADTSSPFHTASRELRDRGKEGDVLLCVSPQVLLEFFAVITNPKRVTKPLAPKEAIEDVKNYVKAKKILKIYPTKDSLKMMMDLAEKHKVKKQEIFDIQLAATMLSNNVTKIYTYNTKHFSKFKEIKVLTP